jgi:hypothetical protein
MSDSFTDVIGRLGMAQTRVTLFRTPQAKRIAATRQYQTSFAEMGHRLCGPKCYPDFWHFEPCLRQDNLGKGEEM